MYPFKNIFQLDNVSIGLFSTNSKTFRHSKEDTAQGLMHKLPLYLRGEETRRSTNWRRRLRGVQGCQKDLIHIDISGIEPTDPPYQMILEYYLTMRLSSTY